MRYFYPSDNVVAAAEANGLRLIVALYVSYPYHNPSPLIFCRTNNWSDYGGMDVYVNQILGSGQPHDYFYTNANVIVSNFQNIFV